MSAGGKIPLLIRKRKPSWCAPGHRETQLKSSLPFYRALHGVKVHRVRSGTVYWRDGKIHHTAFGLWCGQTGFDDGELFPVIPPGESDNCCVACEIAHGNFQTSKRRTSFYEPLAPSESTA